MNELGLLALGGNLPSVAGPPAQTLAAALAALNSGEIRLCAVSRFFATPCFPAGAGPDYVNAAASFVTTLSPGQVLDRLHAIEAAFGRARVQRWGMRTLDLDLIACGDRVLPDAGTQRAWRELPPRAQAQNAPSALILPHPRLQDRAFVLGPLRDIARQWRHPVLGRSVAEMYSALAESDRAALKPL